MGSWLRIAAATSLHARPGLRRPGAAGSTQQVPATMSAMGASTDAAGALLDAGALSLAGHARQRPVVHAACDLLSQGAPGDGVAALAGHPFDDEADTYELELHLRGALDDLGLRLPRRDSDELVVR